MKAFILRNANCLQAIMLLLCCTLPLVSCNNEDLKSDERNTETSEIVQAQDEELERDKSEDQTEKPDVPKAPEADKRVSSIQVIKQPQKREGEGVSDAKLNGEPILLQEDLSARTLASRPDTIKSYLKGVYQGQSYYFHRSVADNFEQGTSTERISYPRLNYRVELFEDEYSTKPYKILSHSVRNEKGNIIVE